MNTTSLESNRDQHISPNYQRAKQIACLSLVAFTAVLFDRLRLLFHFAFKWIDDDQAVLWLAVRELAHGRLHEPRFYGQNYNTYLEALLAVPLYIAGLPLYYALPTITTVLTLLPFFMVAKLSWDNQRYTFTALIAGMPLLLSVEYGLYTSMPRGFVTGLPFATAALCLVSKWEFIRRKTDPFLENPKSTFELLIVGLFAVASISINPNAALLSLPTGVLLLLRWRNRPSQWQREIFFVGIGALVGACFHGLLQAFYIINPEYALHTPAAIKFKFPQLKLGLQNFDQFFQDFSPAGAETSLWCPFIFVVLLIVLIVKKEWAFTGALASTLLVSILALGVPKVHDGTESIYQPLGRMFLALPLLLCLALVWIDNSSQKLCKIIALASTCLTLLFLISRMTSLFERVENIVMSPEAQVQASPISKVFSECDRLRAINKRTQAEVVVFAEHPLSKMLNYACPALWDDKNIETFFPKFERRGWRIQEERDRTRSKILLVFFDSFPKLENPPPGITITVLDRNPRIYLLSTEPLPLEQTLRDLGITVRGIKQKKRLKKKQQDSLLFPQPLVKKQKDLGITTAPLTIEGIYAFTNQARQTQPGIKSLTLSTELNVVAAKKVKDLFEQQYFDHVSPTGKGPADLLLEAQYPFFMSGENLALGGFSSDQALVDAWMASPGHRRNIVEPRFQQIGIAVGQGTYQGAVVWIAVQTFATPRSVCPELPYSLKQQITNREKAFFQLSATLSELKAQMDSLLTAPDEYNKVIPEYNRTVEQANTLREILQVTTGVYNQKLLEYRTCIDQFH